MSFSFSITHITTAILEGTDDDRAGLRAALRFKSAPVTVAPVAVSGEPPRSEFVFDPAKFDAFTCWARSVTRGEKGYTPMVFHETQCCKPLKTIEEREFHLCKSHRTSEARFRLLGTGSWHGYLMVKNTDGVFVKCPPLPGSRIFGSKWAELKQPVWGKRGKRVVADAVEDAVQDAVQDAVDDDEDDTSDEEAAPVAAPVAAPAPALKAAMVAAKKATVDLRRDLITSAPALKAAMVAAKKTAVDLRRDLITSAPVSVSKTAKKPVDCRDLITSHYVVAPVTAPVTAPAAPPLPPIPKKPRKPVKAPATAKTPVAAVA